MSDFWGLTFLQFLILYIQKLNLFADFIYFKLIESILFPYSEWNSLAFAVELRDPTLSDVSVILLLFSLKCR